MPGKQYRVYSLDGVGRLHDAEWFEAASDEDARQQIELKFSGIICEIWQANRLVARIAPDRRIPATPNDWTNPSCVQL